jgi:hypothetical protein
MMKNISPKWLAPLVLCLFSLVCFGCGNDNDSESEDEESAKTTKSKGTGTPAPTKKSALSQKKAQAEAERFFQSFTEALRYDNSDRAISFVVPDHKSKFGIAYPFWQDRRFYDAKVIDVTGNLMRVQVSFEVPTGGRDRELKKLQRVNGKWRLLDDF